MNEFEYNLWEQEKRRMRDRIAANAEQNFFVIKSFEVTSSWEPLQIEVHQPDLALGFRRHSQESQW